MKRCHTCQETKPDSEFYLCRGSLQYRCKQCVKAYNHYYHRHGAKGVRRGRTLVDKRAYWSMDHARFLWKIAKSVNKRLGPSSVWSEEDLVQEAWYRQARKWKVEELRGKGRYIYNHMVAYTSENRSQAGGFEPSSKQEPSCTGSTAITGHFLGEEIVAAAWRIRDSWYRQVFLTWCAWDGDVKQTANRCGVCGERVRQIIRTCKNLIRMVA